MLTGQSAGAEIRQDRRRVLYAGPRQEGKKHRDSACGLISIFIPKTGITARRLASHEERSARWLGSRGVVANKRLLQD